MTPEDHQLQKAEPNPTYCMIKKQIMKKRNLFLAAIVTCLCGCYGSSNIYKSEKTKGVDFTKYKTYAWLPTTDTNYTKILNRKSVERNLAVAVVAQLSKRGMTLDTLNPDCLFTYTLVMNKTYDIGQQPPAVYNPQVYAPMYAGQANVYYYVPYTPVQPAYNGGLQVTTFRDGSLVIDMIDKQNKQIIWRTSAQGKREEDEAKGVRATVEEIVPQMFKKFPIKPVK